MERWQKKQLFGKLWFAGRFLGFANVLTNRVGYLNGLIFFKLIIRFVFRIIAILSGTDCFEITELLGVFVYCSRFTTGNIFFSNFKEANHFL